MTLTDEFCNSKGMGKKEKQECYQIASDLMEVLKDLEVKGVVRSDLRSKEGEGQRALFLKVLLNVRKITSAFNVWFDIYVERKMPNSKQKLKQIMEIGELTEEETAYLLFSEMVFVFLQSIEEFRSSLLSVLKLPVTIEKKVLIHSKTTLNQLLKNLVKLGTKKSESLNNRIDGDLRNGLSHGLFWFSMKDDECPEPHLHYSKDITFKKICCVTVTHLFETTRSQSMYTNCLLNVIADWFE